MSDLVNKAYQATPNATLRDQIMNPNFPKNEREWWAADRIEQLEAALREIGNPPNHFTINDATATARAALGEERT